MSSEALKPDPVTELPLTPPAEDEDEDAAIHSLFRAHKNHIKTPEHASKYSSTRAQKQGENKDYTLHTQNMGFLHFFVLLT